MRGAATMGRSRGLVTQTVISLELCLVSTRQTHREREEEDSNRVGVCAGMRFGTGEGGAGGT